MRILYVSFLHPHMHPGGGQQVAYELLLAARHQGHTASLISAVPMQLLPRHLQSAGEGIHQLQGRDQEFLFVPSGYEVDTFSLTNAASLSAFVQLASKLAPDVIHFHHYHFIGLNSIVALKAILPRARIVMHLHEMLAICWRNGQMINAQGRVCSGSGNDICSACNPEKSNHFFMHRKSAIQQGLAAVDRFITPSNYLNRLYLAWGLEPNKISVIENGLCLPANMGDVSPPGHNLCSFGFFGQLLDAKGLTVIWQAIELMADRNRRLNIRIDINGANAEFASQGFRDQLATFQTRFSAYASCGIDIRLRGRYSRSEIAARMSDIDWVIVPSIWGETFALVLSEAWMFGRVPIASAVGALADRVEHGTNGLLFPMGDGNALAELLTRVAGDDKLHKHLRGHTPKLKSNLDMFADLMPIYTGD